MQETFKFSIINEKRNKFIYNYFDTEIDSDVAVSS